MNIIADSIFVGGSLFVLILVIIILVLVFRH